MLAAALAALVWGTSRGFADTGPGGGSTGVNRLPGADAYSPELARKLADAVAARGANYKPRTRHLNFDGTPKYTNRLILEDSPYLLQHAHNPVNWYPWGDEAFDRARAEKKAVLLSVGYSTCHWCHVMEEESFEDEEIAEYMNRNYVAIKVDRERRPDIDAVYMAAVQSLTGGGGWPMTVWLTPDRKPFYGGTYFPPRDGVRGAGIGFLTLLQRLDAIYRENPQRVVASADQIASYIQRALVPAASSLTDSKLAASLDRAYEGFAAIFDAEHGGFGGAPKFPRTVTLEFLLRYYRRTGNERALQMVVKTLEEMARGGIRDHVGGGFHRYSTDRRWLVPHFEKMVYDNALLAVAYLEGFQASGRSDFAEIARETLRYVAREMTAPEGGFYSATDADSEGVEGKFFTWTPAEIETVLGAERAKSLEAYYGVTESGNFEGRNVLHLAGAVEANGGRSLAESRDDLYRAREKRVPPLKDEKVLVGWNGLMISAFARAAQALGEPEDTDRAAKAADFILTKMRDGQRLRRSWFNGHAEGVGYLDDYAFFEAGLLDLYETSFDPRWLREAIALEDVLEKHFQDEPNGGFFTTPDDGERILAREKPEYDGSEPSGNSVAVSNLLRLAELTTDDRYRARAGKAFSAFGATLEQSPTVVPKMLAAVDFRLDTPKEIVIVKPDREASANPMLSRLRDVFLPNRVLSVAAEGKEIDAQKSFIPLLEGRVAIGGKVTAYVCHARICDLPTTDPDVFAKQVKAKKPTMRAGG